MQRTGGRRKPSGATRFCKDKEFERPAWLFVVGSASTALPHDRRVRPERLRGQMEPRHAFGCWWRCLGVTVGRVLPGCPDEGASTGPRRALTASCVSHSLVFGVSAMIDRHRLHSRPRLGSGGRQVRVMPSHTATRVPKMTAWLLEVVARDAPEPEIPASNRNAPRRTATNAAFCWKYACFCLRGCRKCCKTGPFRFRSAASDCMRR